VGEGRAFFCRFVNSDFYCFNQQYMNHDQYSFIGTFSFQIDCLEQTDQTPNHQFAIRIKPIFPFCLFTLFTFWWYFVFHGPFLSFLAFHFSHIFLFMIPPWTPFSLFYLHTLCCSVRHGLNMFHW
jgi:hypothetical protein